MIIDSFPEVKESAVVGLPHSDFGEQVVAVIVLEKNAQLDEVTVINKMKNKMASFKIPKEVFFFSMMNFQETRWGKFKKIYFGKSLAKTSKPP